MTARKKLKLSDIRLDGGTQARAELNVSVVADYAELLLDGAEIPPVTVFFDGSSHWLADGFHRFHAHAKAGYDAITAVVMRGTVRTAILWAVGCNDDHGLQRSNDDKRRAVGILLDDEEWQSWSQEKIAAQAHVSKSLVSKIVAERASLHGGEMRPAVRTVERSGKTYQLDTSNIGKAKATDSISEVDASSIGARSAPGADRDDTGVAKPHSSPPQAAADGVVERHPIAENGEPPDDEIDLVQELEALNTEVTTLRKLAAADDKTAEALRWRDAYDTLERRCNEHLRTIAARDLQITFLSRQLKRCGKAVGEDDTDKIAPTVERLVREAQEAP